MASFSHARRSGLQASGSRSGSVRIRHGFPPRPKSVRVWEVPAAGAEQATTDVSESAASHPRPWGAAAVWVICGAGILLLFAGVAWSLLKPEVLNHLTR